MSSLELSSLIGRESSRDSHPTGGTRIDLVIYPAADLIITSNITASLLVPDNYTSKGGTKVFISEQYKSYFPSATTCSDSEFSKLGYLELLFPYLNGTTYPLEGVCDVCVCECVYIYVCVSVVVL